MWKHRRKFPTRFLKGKSFVPFKKNRSTTGVALGSFDSVNLAKCKSCVSSMSYWYRIKCPVPNEGVTYFEEHKNWRFNPDEFLISELALDLSVNTSIDMYSHA